MLCKLLALGLVAQAAGGSASTVLHGVNVNLHNAAMSMGVSPDAHVLPPENPERHQDEIEDMKIFQKRDVDKSGFLEANEIDSLMGDVGVAHLVDWKSFDHDGDGKLSRTEFMQAGPAVVKVAQSLAQDVVEQQSLIQQKDLSYFHHCDKDQNGFLNGTEMSEALTGTGLNPEDFNWRAFDHDGDDRLNPAEFLEAGPAVVQAVREHENAGGASSTEEPLDITQKEKSVFAKSDLDRSGFLEPTEVNQLMAVAGLSPKTFNWQAYDYDQDGRLSFDEFLEAGPAAGKAAKEGETHSSGMDSPMKRILLKRDANSSEASLEQEDEVSPDLVFQLADKNQNGFIDGDEGLYGFPWQQFDHDQDGKLSHDEFNKLITEAKYPEEEDDGETPPDDDEDAQSLLEEESEGSEEDEGSDEDEDSDEQPVRKKGLMRSAREDEDDAAGEDEEDDESGSLAEQDSDEDEGDMESEEEDGNEGELGEDEEQDGEEDGDAAGGSSDPKEWAEENFKEHDQDGDGLLDSQEMKKLLKANSAPQHIDWRKYDEDNNGKISKGELLELREKESGYSNEGDEEEEEGNEKEFEEDESEEDGNHEESDSFLEDGEEGAEGEDEDTENDENEGDDAGPTAGNIKGWVDKLLRENDEDKDGFMNSQEIKAAFKKTQAPPHIQWQAFDKDQDGKMSKAELVELVRSEARKGGEEDVDEDEDHDQDQQDDFAAAIGDDEEKSPSLHAEENDISQSPEKLGK